MPSILEEKRRVKLFKFDFTKKLIGADKAEASSSEFKNCKEKMFWTNANVGKLKSIHSSVLQSGDMKATTSFTKQKKSYYFVLKKYYDSAKSKFLLECYKNESMKKLKFIVDLDFVDQIDFKENENLIVLSKSNETCVLDAESRGKILMWLNLICKNCGFNEVDAEAEKKNNNNNNNNKSTSQSGENSETRINTEIEKASKISKQRNLDFNLSLMKDQLENEASESGRVKGVAGVAALSVGSIDCLNLDKIFTKKTDRREENYLHLAQFSSGADDKTPKNFILMNNLATCQSFNSLDDISLNTDKLEKKPETSKRLSKHPNMSVSHNLLDNQNLSNNFILQNLKSLKKDNQLEEAFFKPNKSSIDFNNNNSPTRTESTYDSYEDNLRCSNLEMQITGDYINIYENQNESRLVDYSEVVTANVGRQSKSTEKNPNILRYVPLEVVSNGQHGEHKERFVEAKNDSSENLSFFKKSSTMNSIRSQDEPDKMYTDWDPSRTLALKNAQVEFHKPSFQ